LIAAAVIPGIVATYIHFVEEGELAQRFGREYLEYKARTPFLLGSHLIGIRGHASVRPRPAEDPFARPHESD
jgi:hypothetical protein